MVDAMSSASLPPLPETVEVELTRAERRQVAERLRPSATVLHETIRAEAEVELARPAAALAWSGFAAGLSMGFSLIAMGVIRRALPDVPWRPLVVNLGYSVGFIIVILGRQQLFTENTLTPVLALLHNRDRATLVRLLRLWSIVFATNLLGALLFATVVGSTSVFEPGAREAFQSIGLEAMEGGFLAHALKAVFSGWLIALMVWLLPGAESARVLIIVVLTYLIGIAGLSHIIAGSVECFYVVTTGAASWGNYVTHYLAPVLLGNVVGGMALVAAFTHAEVAAGGHPGPSGTAPPAAPPAREGGGAAR
jgi:formate/nitrite transporter FocA (FNT family)